MSNKFISKGQRAVTLLIIIASIVLRFKTGCFENERNSDRDAA